MLGTSASPLERAIRSSMAPSLLKARRSVRPRQMNAIAKVSTAKALAETFSTMRQLGISDRRLFDEILRETLAQNPQYLGVWTVWEPNALDGRDRDFANAPGHDATGRFIPFWNRGGGAIHLEPNLGYDIPGFGDWYLVPMRRKTETVMDPYEFPFAGRPEFITSQVAPIVFQGKCVGAAGVDIAVDEFVRPEAMRLEETLQRCYIFLSDKGGITYWSERTRDVLARFIGRRLDRELPASIAGHVARLRREDRTVELPALRRGDAILRLKFARHPQNEGFLIIAEEAVAPTPEASLTAREREILEWLGQGKANSEIGVILGISTHTVKRHVERILSKLGVENRYAAALVGLQAR
jgi:DNA-binding CsgD family transcriptional regulator